jgi:hypothetical protein
MPTKIGIRLVSKEDLYKTNIDPQLDRSTVTALTLKDFVKDDSFGPLLANTSIPGSKISTDLNGSKITNETVTGNAENTGTSPVKGKIALSTITGANILDDSIGYGKLTNLTARSVLGRSANSDGNVAAITASENGEILRRSGDVIGFGSINASSIAEGTLAVARGGTGVSQPTNGQLLIGNSSGEFTLGTLTQGTNISITSSDASITIAATFPTATASVNGSQLLPSGIIIKWGELALANFGDGPRAITFNTAFPNNCYQVTTSLDITGYLTSTGANASTQVLDVTRAGFNCYLQHQGTVTGTAGTNCKIRYIAIGN